MSKKHKDTFLQAALVDIAYALHRIADAHADIASAERRIAATAAPMHLASADWYGRLNVAAEEVKKDADA